MRIGDPDIKDKIRNFKSIDLIGLECDFCNILFKRTKKGILKTLKEGKVESFCSRKCDMNNQYQSGKRIKTFITNIKIYYKTNNCLNCNKIILSKYSYCSRQCQQDYKWSLKKKEIEINSNKFDFRTIKKYLLEVRGHKCEDCQNTVWKEQPIPLEMDHIDGNHENNNLDNLRLLCPNCHAMTPTYKAKNVGKGRAKRRQRYKEGKSF